GVRREPRPPMRRRWEVAMNAKRSGELAMAAIVALAGAVLLRSAVHAATPGPGARRFPNVVLQTHTGERVRFYDDVMKGDRIVVLNFMYAKCNGICPGTTSNLLQVERRLAGRVGRDIFLYSISLTPADDTPA